MGKKPILVLVFFTVSLFILPLAFTEVQEEVSVDLLEIWVKVTDKNNRAVTDLAPGDFRVLIDGKEADMQCFDSIFEDPLDFSINDDDFGEDAKPNGPERKFIFFFDLLNSPVRSMDFLKAQMIEFLKTSFRDSDEGMAFVLTPNAHLGVVQKMTNNKEALLDVIHKIRGNPTLESKVRHNEKQILDVLYGQGGSPGGSTPAGDISGVESRSIETVRMARNLARSLALQEENLSQFTLKSFLAIADNLAGNNYPGRLVMVYVSGGFSLRPGQNYFELVNRAIEQTSVVGTEDLVFQEQPDRDFEREVVKTIGALNRLNVTIYSLDARGLANRDRGAERSGQQLVAGFDTLAYTRELQDSLSMVANETGGIAFTGTQNYAKGLFEIASDMGQQYWLCASIPPTKKRGTYHKIQVKVARSDLNVRHRKGYVD
jgi:VWFA-related protein